MVPEKGLEPSQPFGYWNLNPARLPISPLGPDRSTADYNNLLGATENAVAVAAAGGPIGALSGMRREQMFTLGRPLWECIWENVRV